MLRVVSHWGNANQNHSKAPFNIHCDSYIKNIKTNTHTKNQKIKSVVRDVEKLELSYLLMEIQSG
jgi:hypothetical protein